MNVFGGGHDLLLNMFEYIYFLTDFYPNLGSSWKVLLPGRTENWAGLVASRSGSGSGTMISYLMTNLISDLHK